MKIEFVERRAPASAALADEFARFEATLKAAAEPFVGKFGVNVDWAYDLPRGKNESAAMLRSIPWPEVHHRFERGPSGALQHHLTWHERR